MKTIDSLSKTYDSLHQIYATLTQLKNNIQAEEKYGESIIKTLARLLKCYDSFRDRLNSAMLPCLSDAVALLRLCQNCYTAVEDYRTLLLNNIKYANPAAEKLKKAKNVFDDASRRFFAQYKIRVSDESAMVLLLSHSIQYELSEIKSKLGNIRNEAKRLLAHENNLEISAERTNYGADRLPEYVVVARHYVSGQQSALLGDIGMSDSYQDLSIDLRNSGNVIITTDYTHMADNAIDRFITAYILKFFEVFPIGSVRVHIIDDNACYLYRRLYSGIKRRGGDVSKQPVSLYENAEKLPELQKVICDDIFPKTGSDCPDLYAVYEHDQTDTFNLIVLRDGLIGQGGYASDDLLKTLDVLTNQNETAHKCGMRFLLIDDSDSRVKGLSDFQKSTIKSIRSHCELQLSYTNEAFVIHNNKTKPLTIIGDPDVCVQVHAEKLSELFSSQSRTVITLDDIKSDAEIRRHDSILTIPVGKSGTQTVELPLSCKDENNTLAGQCIGYMVIGQSGSGKSSFFHSLVLNGCLKYAPETLEFWLLDFKHGGASSKYSSSVLPHIRMIAENNKIDDAFCLFRMIFEEIERRNKAFNAVGTDNISDYNRKAEEVDELVPFPRIIIAIDEVQEIFRDENAAALKDLISSISVRMRSSGIHFVMVAQNLTEGKSYMLKDAFLPSASGRICFRVADNIARDSGFPEEFTQRRQEIAELQTGEAYVSYGKDTIRKVKFSFTSATEMNRYFEEIKERYPQTEDKKTCVIGSRRRLTINDALQKETASYYDVIHSLEPENDVFKAVAGEDVYRMEPLYLRFSPYRNSSVLLLGDDKRISSSLCAFIAASLIRQNARVHLFNADKARIDNITPHPFMFLCQQYIGAEGGVCSYKLSRLPEVLEQLHQKYTERRTIVQDSEDELPHFEPEFLIINDLFGIEAFCDNATVGTTNDASSAYDLFQTNSAGETVQNVLSTLLESGYRYNIHVVLAIKGDPYTWKTSSVTAKANQIIMFNQTRYADEIENSYYIKEMLKNITNSTGGETLAVWYRDKQLSKLRPLICDMSNNAERDRLEMLMERRTEQ